MTDNAVDPDWVDIADADTLTDGQQRTVWLGLTRLLLIRDADTLHAVTDICPHARQPLCGGVVAGGILQCPKHGARFHLHDGQPANGVTAKPLPVHDIRIFQGRVQVTRTPRHR